MSYGFAAVGSVTASPSATCVSPFAVNSGAETPAAGSPSFAASTGAGLGVGK